MGRRQEEVVVVSAAAAAVRDDRRRCPGLDFRRVLLRIVGLVYIEKKFNPMNSSIFVLFSKYCPIVDQLSSKDSSRDFQLNCAISYFFYLHLMLHANG